MKESYHMQFCVYLVLQRGAIVRLNSGDGESDY